MIYFAQIFHNGREENTPIKHFYVRKKKQLFTCLICVKKIYIYLKFGDNIGGH